MQSYKQIQPNAKFFFVTILKDKSYPKAERHRELLAQLTEKFDNCYLIDLYKYLPEYDDKLKEQLFMHGHMNPMGYVFTADIIAAYIDYIVRNNPKDFEMVGLM